MANDHEKLICEVECPECGEMVKICHIGFTECPCGNAIAELTVNWEIKVAD